MVEDLESALAEARKWNVKALPQGHNWLQLPDGLAIELTGLLSPSPDACYKIYSFSRTTHMPKSHF